VIGGRERAPVARVAAMVVYYGKEEFVGGGHCARMVRRGAY
jgi:hypothetical protein